MINFKDLKLDEVKLEDAKIQLKDFNEPIRVKPYVGLATKQTIIALALQEAMDEDGRINRAIADARFSLYTLFCYSDLIFSDEEKANADATYDLLESTQIMDRIISEIPKIEYENLVEAYETAVIEYNEYRNSVAYVVEYFFTRLPGMLETMNNSLAEFDPSQLQVLNSVLDELGGDKSAVDQMLLGQK